MFKRTFFRLTLILGFVFILCIGGVYATWRYAEFSPIEAEQMISISMGELVLHPEDVLPDDEQADEAQGNHLVLIRNIIIETDYMMATNSPSLISNET